MFKLGEAGRLFQAPRGMGVSTGMDAAQSLLRTVYRIQAVAVAGDMHPGGEPTPDHWGPSTCWSTRKPGSQRAWPSSSDNAASFLASAASSE